MVDASVIACADRFSAVKVAAVDRKQSGAVRPAHVPSLTLLP
ncbi:hypothetical protein [Streptomyces canus]